MSDFDKNFDSMSKNFNRTFGVMLCVSALGALASLGVVVTIIYLLLKNFG